MIKKICFFTTHYDFPRQWLMEYYERIIPGKTKIFLFCDGKDAEKFKLKKTKIIGYKKIKVFWELRRFCREKNIDVVTNLSGKNNTAFVMGISIFGLKTKNIFYNHSNPSKKELLFFALFQFLTDRILIGADDLKKKIRRFLFNKEKIFTLTTPINTELFKPKNKKQARKKLKFLNLSPNDMVISYVGRISFLKGSDFLLKAIKSNPEKKFILIGKIEDRNYNFNELKNAIHIPEAERSHLPDYLNASDLFLFFSRTEGLGAAYREAMACGIPAIVSDIEAVRTVKTAIKVPFNVGKIQKKINWFFALPKKEKTKLSKQVISDMEKNHSEKSLKNIHLKYFLNV